jgi:Phosphoserine phosphatase RsbU, N-terminal domain/GAF domain
MSSRSFDVLYATALDDYLRDASEANLLAAYELGREAIGRQLSVLDLAMAHQEALSSVFARTFEVAEVPRIVRAAGDFFLEGLASFEMVQRGFGEARQAVRAERRQTALSRQLSSFLANATLALDGSASLDELLQLVAEQGRELVSAECCMATLAVEGCSRGASFLESEARWKQLVRWLDLSAICRFVRSRGGSVRVGEDDVGRLPFFGSVAGERLVRGWLAASLTALDGSELGAIQAFDKHDGSFTNDDEAALVHLAQMVSAAVERSRLYQDHQRASTPE